MTDIADSIAPLPDPWSVRRPPALSRWRRWWGAAFAVGLSVPVAGLVLAFDVRRGNPLAGVVTALLALVIAGVAGWVCASAPSLRRPSGSTDRVVVAMALLIVVLGDLAVATLLAIGLQAGSGPCVFTLMTCAADSGPNHRDLLGDIVLFALWGPLFYGVPVFIAAAIEGILWVRLMRGRSMTPRAILIDR